MTELPTKLFPFTCCDKVLWADRPSPIICGFCGKPIRCDEPVEVPRAGKTTLDQTDGEE